ncbi:MAG: 50S ribosomal protein L21 [Candidatus Marinimicrobia bacterium]|nr:50S ribosomal protein L21 [Candidatus Neomarinimicrobiota bacterium]MBL7066855.1 50S ribosomal protein L21 [Candidatus Neomarinimicrobiota bacterium]
MKSDLYAIAEISGDQVVLETGKKIAVPKLDIEAGQEYTVDSVLYLREGDNVKIGKPHVKGAKIKTIIVEHKRLPKIIVFKKKRRKGYKVKKGHRQPYTLLEVTGLKVEAKAQPKKTVPKVQEKKEDVAKQD